MTGRPTRLPDFAVVCGLNGVVHELISNVAGITPAPAAGMPISEVVHGASRAKADELLRAASAGRCTSDWLIDLTAATGPVAMRISGVRNGSELVIFGRPSVEQHQLYSHLTSLNNDLATAQRMLIQKNAELERLNTEKTRFLGMAAHDLRTPLGIIEIYSQFLLEDPSRLGPDQVEFISVISRSAHGMLALIDNLLDLATIESGRLNLECERADIRDIVQTNVTVSRILAARKCITIQMRLPDGPCLVWADPGKIGQVLDNLISNALKFSPNSAEVEVRVEKERDGVRVAVRDHGPGIKEAEKDKLFQPFERTSAKPTGGEHSSGLGLAIVKRIVEGHGGMIGVESEVGIGSEFWFTLPSAPEHSQ